VDTLFDIVRHLQMDLVHTIEWEVFLFVLMEKGDQALHIHDLVDESTLRGYQCERNRWTDSHLSLMSWMHNILMPLEVVAWLVRFCAVIELVPSLRIRGMA
jgi:hypothetical protein